MIDFKTTEACWKALIDGKKLGQRFAENPPSYFVHLVAGDLYDSNGYRQTFSFHVPAYPVLTLNKPVVI